MKTVAYIRVSTDKQTSENQRNEISRYAVDKKIMIYKWFDFQISTRKSEEERGINELLSELNKGDTLIVSELSRLGRSQSGVLNLIDTLIKNGVTTICLKENITIKPDGNDLQTQILISVFTMVAQLERSFVSMRTREALSSRKGKGVLGHKKGDLLKSQYDKDVSRILELKEYGLSNQKIVNQLKYGSQATLSTYLDKRFDENMFGGLTLKEKLKKDYIIEDGEFRKVIK